jgi:hypothetical protein
VEVESVAVVASAHGEVEDFTRRIALLEGELVEVRQAQETAEENSRGLSDTAADVEQWWEESKRDAGNGLKSLPSYKPRVLSCTKS